MTQVLIEVDAGAAADIEQAKSLLGTDMEVVESDRFDGQGEIITALVTLGTVSISVIGKIFIEGIRAKRHRVVKYKGMSISGVNDKTIITILEKIHREN